MQNTAPTFPELGTCDASREAQGRFYWCVLEAPGLNHPRPSEAARVLPPGLREAAGDEFPEPLDQLHVVCLPLTAGRTLVCATPRQKLLDLDPAAERHAPSSIPDCIGVQASLPEASGNIPTPPALAPTPEQFNMLIGDFEPARHRRARARCHLTLAAAVLACGTLVCVGLARRAAHWRDLTASAGNSSAAIATQLGTTPARLAADLAAQQSSLAIAAKLRPAPDASLALAALLTRWPTADGFAAQPTSVLVSEKAVTVSVAIDGDPAPFLKALTPPPGWRLDEPRLNSAGKAKGGAGGAGGAVTRVTLQFTPPLGGEGAQP